MGLETATYIDGLNAAYPLSSDPSKQGDDHIRLIKSTLKATFPNVDGPVNLTDAALNFPVPIGCILAWYGATVNIPAGWVNCAGGTHTRTDGGGSITAPDLRAKVILGAGNTYVTGDIGGSFYQTTANGGSHSHGGSTGSGGVHNHTMSTDGAHTHTTTAVAAGAHTHSGDTGAGGNHTHGAATGGYALVEDDIPSHFHYAFADESVGATGVPTSTRAVAVTASLGSDASYQIQRGPGGTATANVGTTSRSGGNASHSHSISASGTHTHAISSDGSHTHSVSTASAGGHDHTVANSAAHSHTITADTGHTHTVDVRQPYMVLHWIMKI